MSTSSKEVFFIDDSDRKVKMSESNKHICQGCKVPLLLLVHPVSLSAEFL